MQEEVISILLIFHSQLLQALEVEAPISKDLSFLTEFVLPHNPTCLKRTVHLIKVLKNTLLPSSVELDLVDMGSLQTHCSFPRTYSSLCSAFK